MAKRTATKAHPAADVPTIKEIREAQADDLRRWPRTIDRFARPTGITFLYDTVDGDRVIPLADVNALAAWIEARRQNVLTLLSVERTVPHGLKLAAAVLHDGGEWLRWFAGEPLRTWTPPTSADDAKSQLANLLADVTRNRGGDTTRPDKTADNSTTTRRVFSPKDTHVIGAANYIKSTRGKPGTRIQKVRDYCQNHGIHSAKEHRRIDKQLQRYRVELKLADK